MKFRAKGESGGFIPIKSTADAKNLLKYSDSIRIYAQDGTECTPEAIDELNRSHRLGFLCIAILGLLTAIAGIIEIITQ